MGDSEAMRQVVTLLVVIAIIAVHGPTEAVPLPEQHRAEEVALNAEEEGAMPVFNPNLVDVSAVLKADTGKDGKVVAAKQTLQKAKQQQASAKAGVISAAKALSALRAKESSLAKKVQKAGPLSPEALSKHKQEEKAQMATHKVEA